MFSSDSPHYMYMNIITVVNLWNGTGTGIVVNQWDGTEAGVVWE